MTDFTGLLAQMLSYEDFEGFRLFVGDNLQRVVQALFGSFPYAQGMAHLIYNPKYGTTNVEKAKVSAPYVWCGCINREHLTPDRIEKAMTTLLSACSFLVVGEFFEFEKADSVMAKNCKAEATHRFKQIGEEGGQALALIRLAHSAKDSGDRDWASYYIQAKELLDRIGSPLAWFTQEYQTEEDITGFCLGQSLAFHMMCDFGALFDVSGEWPTHLPSLRIAFACQLLGAGHIDWGGGRTAIPYLQRAMRLYRQLGLGDYEALVVPGLAEAHLQVGDTDKAIQYCTDTLDMALDSSPRFKLGRAQAQHVLGNALGYMGRDEEAIQHYEKACTLFDELGIENASVLMNMGTSYRQLGQIEKAIQLHIKARDLAARQDNLLALGFALRALAADYLESKQLDQAVNCVNWALNLSVRIENPRLRSDCLSDLGILLLDLGLPQLALEHFRQAASIARQLSAPRWESLAETNTGVALGKLGYHADAVSHFHKAIAIADKNGDLRRYYLAAANLGIAHHDYLPDFPLAYKCYATAAQSLEELRSSIKRAQWKEAFLVDKIDVYARMVRLLCLDMDDATWEEVKKHARQST